MEAFLTQVEETLGWDFAKATALFDQQEIQRDLKCQLLRL
jgi:hypothetical protein